jgi:hypothetical protein
MKMNLNIQIGDHDSNFSSISKRTYLRDVLTNQVPETDFPKRISAILRALNFVPYIPFKVIFSLHPEAWARSAGYKKSLTNYNQ